MPRSLPLQTGGGADPLRLSDAMDKISATFAAKLPDPFIDVSVGISVKLGRRLSAWASEHIAIMLKRSSKEQKSIWRTMLLVAVWINEWRREVQKKTSSLLQERGAALLGTSSSIASGTAKAQARYYSHERMRDGTAITMRIIEAAVIAAHEGGERPENRADGAISHRLTAGLQVALEVSAFDDCPNKSHSEDHLIRSMDLRDTYCVQ